MFCPYIPRGALTPYAAESAGWPWPDICHAVLGKNLPAYVASSDAKTWRVAPEQFARLLTENPFNLESTFWIAGDHAVRTTESADIVGQIFFFKHDLERAFPAATEANGNDESPPKHQGKGGRKPKIDWELVNNEVSRLMNHHGEFMPCDPEWNSQAKLENKIADFITEKFDVTLTESTIRDHVAAALAKWRREKGYPDSLLP